MGKRTRQRVDDAPHDSPAQPLRVLLIDDGAHHVGLIHDELARLGHLVVGVLDSALLIHDCVLRLQPDVVIVDSESPTRHAGAPGHSVGQLPAPAGGVQRRR